MTINILRANDRGLAEHGWLHSRFSFSFANYFDPKRMGFGALRVLNDDIIQAGYGFPTHPHDNMEIISIPTKGVLAHKDSTGVEETVEVGEVQVMSAGSGVSHSEYNHSEHEAGEFFQIWIDTKERDITPRHDKKKFDFEQNKLELLVSGNKSDNVLYIHQDAKISMGKFDAGEELNYSIALGNGLFLMVVSGDVQIDEASLQERDAIEISDEKNVLMKMNGNSEVLLIEVPL